VTVLLHKKWELRESRHRPVIVEKSGSRLGVGNNLTGAQLPPHDLHFPCRAAPQRRPVCTQTATYVAYFFQADFELHPYDVEK
jgi:hypothetical protein